MAVELVGGALLSASLQVLFERLASEEIPLLFRGKKPILELLDELNTMLLSADLLLNYAEDEQIKDDKVKKWLDKLQEVVYDADDLVDSIDTEALRCKIEGESSSSVRNVIMNFIPTSLNPFDNTVKCKATEILRRLKGLLDQKDALGFKVIAVQNKSLPRPPAPLVEESDVYGRSGDKEAIVNMLLSVDASTGNKLSVIPIVGMGGIGKTTLAQLVYDDVRVQNHFELKAWVTVSDEFDIYKITKTIFEKVTSKKCHMEDVFELQHKLKEALRGKKFLFVHDDVWNENYHLWNSLKSSFESGADGSKIIATTRSTKVASIMAMGKAYEPTDLSHEDCWRLFVKHAFGINEDLDAYRDLQVIGRQIVSKCKGLPLAIKSIGGLLCCERNPKNWESILKSEVWEHLYKKEGNILPALWLSYRHLPTHLKRCFAYCSIFPKDYKFEKKIIILLWMAEGFLQTDNKGTQMEELGEKNIQELLSRSLFQQLSWDESFFVMHDLVHDLAMFAAGEFCFMLDHTNGFQNLSSKIRHLSYKKDVDDDSNKLEGLIKANCLRTFVAFSRCLFPNALLVERSCLRVLHLRRSSMKELPDSIGNLKYLRYLDLSFTEIAELPNSICTLYNLQTLLLFGCRRLTELPKDMGSLINLRHLDINGVPLKGMPPQSIRNMRNLQLLPRLILGDGHSGPKIEELKELEHLHGRLDISGLENIVDSTEALEANLKDKKCLSELSLRWEANAVAESSQKEKAVLDGLRPHRNLRELKIESYRGTTLSDWVGHHLFSNTVSISLRNCKSCWFLPPLGQLPSLKYLTIDGFHSVVSIGDEFIGESSSFRFLEQLTFEDMLELKQWSFSEAIHDCGIFPCLTGLILRNCPKLIVGLPCHLPSLEQLTIDGLDSVVSVGDKFFCNSPSSFKCLKELTFANMLELKEWSFSEAIQEAGIFPHLTKFYLNNCKQLNVGLPGRLPSLEQLRIEGCKNVVSVGDELFLNSRVSFRSLEKLKFENMWELKEWSFSEVIQGGGIIFPRLKEFSLVKCPKLKVGLPGQLPALKRLRIHNCNEMEVLLPRSNNQQTPITAFPSLVYISVLHCPALESLLEWGSHSKLKELYLSKCKTLLEKRMRWDLQRLSSLEHLYISGWEDDSFPDDGLLPTNLATLYIINCRNLQVLNGKALQQLTSLKSLGIWECPKLRCLPEQGLPTCLSELHSYGCPLLKERCQKQGQDWPKISHIASLNLRDSFSSPSWV